MLITETPDKVLEEYTKERCDEMINLYDGLKRSIMQLSKEEDELKKFNLLVDIAKQIQTISDEHINTLDRYLYSYELNKRLENKITKLEHPEVEERP